MRAALIATLFGAAIAAPVAQLDQVTQAAKGVAPALSGAADVKDTAELLTVLQEKRQVSTGGGLPGLNSLPIVSGLLGGTGGSLPIGKRQGLPVVGDITGGVSDGKSAASPVQDATNAASSRLATAQSARASGSAAQSSRVAAANAARASALPQASNLPNAAEGLPIVGSLLGGGLGGGLTKRQGLPVAGGLTGNLGSSSTQKAPTRAENLAAAESRIAAVGSSRSSAIDAAQDSVRASQSSALPATPSLPVASNGLPVVGGLLSGGLPVKKRADIPVVGQLLKSVSNGNGGAVPLPIRRIRRGDIGMQCVGAETGRCASADKFDDLSTLLEDNSDAENVIEVAGPHEGSAPFDKLHSLTPFLEDNQDTENIVEVAGSSDNDNL